MSHALGFLSDTDAIHDRYPAYHGQLAFDIGANGGLVSNIFARRFDSVVACEPCSESYLVLTRRAAPNVTPLNIAVSDVNGEVALRETSLTETWGELFTGDSLPWGETVGQRIVPALTLDHLVELYGHPDFVKIDTEGHERAVMEGGTALFDEPLEFIIEVHDVLNGEWAQQFLADRNHGFVVVRHADYDPTSTHWFNHYWLCSEGAAS